MHATSRLRHSGVSEAHGLCESSPLSRHSTRPRRNTEHTASNTPEPHNRSRVRPPPRLGDLFGRNALDARRRGMLARELVPPLLRPLTRV